MSMPFSFAAAYFIEALIFLLYADAFFVPKSSFFKRLICLGGSYTGLIFLFSLNLSELNILLYSLINFILLNALYEMKWYLSAFHAIVLTALMSACEFLSISILSAFAPAFLHHYAEFPYAFLFVLFSKGLFYIAVYLLTFFFRKGDRHLQKDWHPLLLLFIPVSTIFTLISLINIGQTILLPSAMNRMIAGTAVLLLISNIFVFGINQYTQKKNAQYTELQLLLQKESDAAAYYEMLLSQNEAQRILIHGMKNHLQSIEILNSAKEHEKIASYIHTLLQSSSLTEGARLCDRHMLNIILSRYQQQCREKQIAFHTDIRKDALHYLSDADITAVFCNLLDNAVEAARKMPDSLIELNVHPKANTPFTVITMINSCPADPFVSHTLPSSKKDPSLHGFGLKSVQRTAKRYHGSTKVYYDKEERLFHTIVMLKEPYKEFP